MIYPLRRRVAEGIRKIVFPLPEDQSKQGFEPNFYIRSLRGVSKFLIFLLRLNGKNRFSNEFIQMLDPKLAVDLPEGENLVFRTGHGRLLWRARTLWTYEPMIMDWIAQFSPDDCFYDVGANMGCYSLYASKRGVRTYAFEPETTNAQLLYENIFLNGLQDLCVPVPVALSDTTGTDTFFLKSISKGDALNGIGRRSYLLADPSAASLALNILVARLDDLIHIFGLPLPTRLKVDVDGNELQVVQGAMKTLEHVRDVYIEIDSKQAEHREVMSILEESGFHLAEEESLAHLWNQEIRNCLFSRG